MNDYNETIRHIEAEWGNRYEAVKREADYWRQRHDAVMNAVSKSTLLTAPSQPTMLADPESYELGKLHGATAERERAALKGYAGITIWGGDATVTKIFTEEEMKYAIDTRALINYSVQQCLDALAAHDTKEQS